MASIVTSIYLVLLAMFIGSVVPLTAVFVISIWVTFKAEFEFSGRGK